MAAAADPLHGLSADPQGRHRGGRAAAHVLDQARAKIGAALGVEHQCVSFLASSSQALVAGLSGLSHARRRLGSRMVATAVDRSVVLNNASTEAIVPVDRDGRVSVADFAAALTADTALATLQFGNPEVGTRQPVPGAYAACRARGIPLLLDASAALGRAEIPNDWDVLVGDGAIVVLGGLLSDEYAGNQEKVPGLADIPLFGNLFKGEARSRKKTNLMVFLRPVVLRDAAASDSFSMDRYELMRATQQQAQPEPSAAVPVNGAPVLPGATQPKPAK